MEEPIFNRVPPKSVAMKKTAVIDRNHFLAIIQRMEAQHDDLDVLAQKINETLAQAIWNPKFSPAQLEEMRADAVGGQVAARHPGIANRIRTIEDLRSHLDEFPRP